MASACALTELQWRPGRLFSQTLIDGLGTRLPWVWPCLRLSFTGQLGRWVAIIVINRIFLHTVSFCGLLTVAGSMRCVYNWKMLAFCEIRNCLKMPKFGWNFFDRPTQNTFNDEFSNNFGNYTKITSIPLNLDQSNV